MKVLHGKSSVIYFDFVVSIETDSFEEYNWKCYIMPSKFNSKDGKKLFKIDL
jgi:hypothetical protein